jgi:hypothetical protein
MSDLEDLFNAMRSGAEDGRRSVVDRFRVYDQGMTRRLDDDELSSMIVHTLSSQEMGETAALPREAAARLDAWMRGEADHVLSAVGDTHLLGAQAARPLNARVRAESRLGAAGVRPVRTDVAVRMPVLSPTIWNSATEVSGLMRAQLEDTLRLGASTRDLTASFLRNVGNTRLQPPPLPAYIRRVQEAVLRHPGDQVALKRAVRAGMSQVRALGAVAPESSLRSWAGEFMHRVERSGGRDLQRQLDYFVNQRAKYHVRRVVRTEMARAYSQSYIQNAEAQGFRAVKWNLSPQHPRPDVCDIYANADPHGMGKGVYPSDKVPTMPAHPHCLCYLSAWFDESGADMVAEARRARGIDTPEDRAVLDRFAPNPARAQSFGDYVAGVDQDMRRQILGRGVERIFMERPDLRERIVGDGHRGIMSLRDTAALVAANPLSGARASVAATVRRAVAEPDPPATPSAPVAPAPLVEPEPPPSTAVERLRERGLLPPAANRDPYPEDRARMLEEAFDREQRVSQMIEEDHQLVRDFDGALRDLRGTISARTSYPPERFVAEIEYALNQAEGFDVDDVLMTLLEDGGRFERWAGGGGSGEAHDVRIGLARTVGRAIRGGAPVDDIITALGLANERLQSTAFVRGDVGWRALFSSAMANHDGNPLRGAHDVFGQRLSWARSWASHSHFGNAAVADYVLGVAPTPLQTSRTRVAVDPRLVKHDTADAAEGFRRRVSREAFGRPDVTGVQLEQAVRQALARGDVPNSFDWMASMSDDPDEWRRMAMAQYASTQAELERRSSPTARMQSIRGSRATNRDHTYISQAEVELARGVDGGQADGLARSVMQRVRGGLDPQTEPIPVTVDLRRVSSWSDDNDTAIEFAQNDRPQQLGRGDGVVVGWRVERNRFLADYRVDAALADNSESEFLVLSADTGRAYARLNPSMVFDRGRGQMWLRSPDGGEPHYQIVGLDVSGGNE